ncbi:MAG: TonB-dependent receptor, partial [Sphingobium sp.]
PKNADRIPLIVNYPVSPKNPRAADWDDQGFPLRRNNEFYQLSLRGDVDLSDSITLTSITAWNRMDIDQRNDLDGTAITAGRNHVRGVVSSLSQELRLSGSMGPLQWVLGANYARDKANESTFLENLYTTATYTIPTGPFLTNDLFSDQKFVSKAVFANVDYELTDRLTAHAGIRYTDADLDYRSCSKVGDPVTAASLTAFYNILRAGQNLPALSPIAAGQCISLNSALTPELRVGELDETSTSWRLGLDFKPAPRTLIYANVSRGYKGGSNPVIGALSAAQLTPVTQESVTAYEIGFKVPVAGRAVELSGAAFYYDYRDKQLKGRVRTTPDVFGALEGLVNVPKSWVKGAEFQANVYPVSGLTLMLGGTYLKTKVTSDFTNYTITGQIANFQGDAFPYTPKWQLVADAAYEWRVSDEYKAFVGANANYRTKTRSGFGQEAVLNIDSYTLVDGRLGVRSDNGWEASLFVRNIFNEYYWTNVARFLDTTRRFTGMPRTFGVQLGYKFN